MLGDMVNAGVLMRIGDKVHTVHELTLRDHAELEAWARSLCPSGFEALYLDKESEDYLDRVKELRGRIRAADHIDFLAHSLGLAKLAAKAIRLPRDTDAVLLLASAKEAQVRHLVKVAYGSDPIAMLDDLIWPEDAAIRQQPGRDQWTMIIDHLCREYGWTLREALDLTPTQAGYFLRKGKSESPSIAGPQDIYAHFRRSWRRMYGEDGPPNGNPGQSESRRSDAAGEGEPGGDREGTG